MIVRMSKDMKQMQAVINNKTFSYDTDAIMEIASKIGEQKDTQACVNAITALVNFVIDKSIIPGKEYVINQTGNTKEREPNLFGLGARKTSEVLLARTLLHKPLKEVEEYFSHLSEKQKEYLASLIFNEYHKS